MSQMLYFLPEATVDLAGLTCRNGSDWGYLGKKGHKPE